MTADFERIALRANPDAVCITASTGELVHWSDGAQAVFGHAAGAALGQSLRRLLIPDEAHDAYRRVVAAALRGECVTYETVCRRKDGALIHVDGTCKAVRAPDGAADYLLFAKKDVTPLHVARRAGALARDHADLLEAMPDGILLVEPAGRIVFANAQAERMFGHARGALPGSEVELLLPPRLRAAHRERRAAYFAQPRPRTLGADLDLWGLRANGSEFPLDLSLSPLRTDSGVLAICAMRDITERKRAELVLASKTMELDKARDVRRLQGSVSHALRTSLNSIIGFSGTLLMQLPGPLTAEQRQQIGTIKASAHDLLRAVDGALGVFAADGRGKPD